MGAHSFRSEFFSREAKEFGQKCPLPLEVYQISLHMQLRDFNSISLEFYTLTVMLSRLVNLLKHFLVRNNPLSS